MPESPPRRSCPMCRQPGRSFRDGSQTARVDYYICDGCGHVWSHRKGDPKAPAVHVTLPGRAKPLAATLPLRFCPNCDERGRHLEGASQGAMVDFYICDHCGVVWSHKKGDPKAPAVNVAYPRIPRRA